MKLKTTVAAIIATYFESKLQNVVSSKLANVKLAQKKNILIPSKTTQEIKCKIDPIQATSSTMVLFEPREGWHLIN